MLLAVHVTPANEQERAQVKELAQAVREVTQNSVEVAFVDQGYTGPLPEQQAKEAGIELIVVKLPEAKKGFVLLPRRWVVERLGLHGWRVGTLSLPIPCYRMSAQSRPDTVEGDHAPVRESGSITFLHV